MLLPVDDCPLPAVPRRSPADNHCKHFATYLRTELLSIQCRDCGARNMPETQHLLAVAG